MESSVIYFILCGVFGFLIILSGCNPNDKDKYLSKIDEEELNKELEKEFKEEEEKVRQEQIEKIRKRLKPKNNL